MPQAASSFAIENAGSVTVTIFPRDEKFLGRDPSYVQCSKRPRTAMNDVTKHVNIPRSLSHRQAGSHLSNVKIPIHHVPSTQELQPSQKRKVTVPKGENAPPPPTTSSCSDDERGEYLDTLLQSEDSFRLNTIPPVVQKEVNSAMRALLVDWMVEVNQEFRCSLETLYLAVAIVDRYVHLRPVSMSSFQLLGITCLWIAMKLEETEVRNAYECVDMTDRSYTISNLLNMEKDVLSALSFRLSIPTTPLFLDAFALNSGLQDKAVIALAHYLAELVLVYGTVPQFRMSEVAAAALYVAISTVYHKDPVPRRLIRATGYTLEQLSPIIKAISHLHLWACGATCQCAVKRKYSSSEHYKVATVVPHEPRPIRVSTNKASAAAYTLTKYGAPLLVAARGQ